MDDMGHTALGHIKKAKGAHPAKASFALISAKSDRKHQIEGLFAAMQTRKVPENFAKIMKERMENLIQTSSHSHREQLRSIAQMQGLEQLFNELDEKHPMSPEEEKASTRPAPNLVDKIVADTAALLLQQAIGTGWVLERLKRTVPSGILHATVEQISRGEKGEGSDSERLAAIVRKIQDAGSSIDLSKIQIHLQMTPLERSYWDLIKGQPVPKDMQHFIPGDKSGKRTAIAWRDDGGARKYFLRGDTPLQVGTILTGLEFDKRYAMTVVGLGNLGDPNAPMWRRYVIAKRAGSSQQVKLDITHINATQFTAFQPAFVPVKGPALAPG